MSKPTEETTGGPSEVSKENLSICSLCGASVVPEPVETPTGTRYKCPECKKFMKPLTPEEAAEREEAKRGPLPPTEVEMTERVKELLAKNLSRVYGIPKKESSKRIDAIIDTLSPVVATDPWNLHNHIKNFAPNADDRHLESIINKVFSQLEAEGYRPTEVRDYQPTYGRRRRREYRPRYSPPGDYGREYGYYGRRYPEEYEAPPPPPRRRSSRMKVVVDGQEIETDYGGYMAHQTFKREQSEETRRQREHDLRMKRLEAEIKKITAETVGSKGETLVKVKVGEEEMEVPASIAPLYLKRESEEVKELRRDIKDLTGKLHEKEIGELRSDLERVSKKLEEQPSFFEQMEMMDKYAETKGYTKTGRTTIDLLSDLGGKADARAQQLIQRMPGGQGEFKPEVKRTPEERRRKAAQIEKRLRKKEEVLEAEDELIKAAAKM